jgi:hypothetical protein
MVLNLAGATGWRGLGGQVLFPRLRHLLRRGHAVPSGAGFSLRLQRAAVAALASRGRSLLRSFSVAPTHAFQRSWYSIRASAICSSSESRETSSPLTGRQRRILRLAMGHAPRRGDGPHPVRRHHRNAGGTAGAGDESIQESAINRGSRATIGRDSAEPRMCRRPGCASSRRCPRQRPRVGEPPAARIRAAGAAHSEDGTHGGREPSIRPRRASSTSSKTCRTLRNRICSRNRPAKASTRMTRHPVAARAEWVQIATTLLPTLWASIGSITLETGTSARSQNMTWLFVGMDCRNSSRFASDAAIPAASR